MNAKIERQLKVIQLNLNQACQEIEFPADAVIYGPEMLASGRLLIGSPLSGGSVRRKVWLLSNLPDNTSHPMNTISSEAQQNDFVGFSVDYTTQSPRYLVVFVETQINAATRASTTRR